jgi:hypothetical protein
MTSHRVQLQIDRNGNGPKFKIQYTCQQRHIWWSGRRVVRPSGAAVCKGQQKGEGKTNTIHKNWFYALNNFSITEPNKRKLNTWFSLNSLRAGIVISRPGHPKTKLRHWLSDTKFCWIGQLDSEMNQLTRRPDCIYCTPLIHNAVLCMDTAYFAQSLCKYVSI